MAEWWFMFICDMLIPAIMVIVGHMMWKHYPKEINWAFGYRTRRSMMNDDTWKFAHEFCGRLWWKIGWIMTAASFLAMLPFINSSEDEIAIFMVILIFIQMGVLLLSIIPTERALKRTFNDDGSFKHEER
jgi:uncharacterized membrane protein